MLSALKCGGDKFQTCPAAEVNDVRSGIFDNLLCRIQKLGGLRTVPAGIGHRVAVGFGYEVLAKNQSLQHKLAIGAGADDPDRVRLDCRWHTEFRTETKSDKIASQVDRVTPPTLTLSLPVHLLPCGTFTFNSSIPSRAAACSYFVPTVNALGCF